MNDGASMGSGVGGSRGKLISHDSPTHDSPTNGSGGKGRQQPPLGRYSGSGGGGCIGGER